MDTNKIMNVLDSQYVTIEDIIGLCEYFNSYMLKFGNIYLYKYSDEKNIELINAVSPSRRSQNIEYLGITSDDYRILFDNFRKMSNRQKLEWLVKVNNINVRTIKLKLKQL